MAILLSALLITGQLQDLRLQSLFLMQQDKVVASIERYKDYTSAAGRHDFETLQQLGLNLLQRGSMNADSDVFLMTLFGAGLSGSTAALDILEKGLNHPDPQTELMALHFISQIEDDRTNDLLHRAMSSNFLSTRMEAAFYLAQRKAPHAVGQIEGLMFRLPPAFKPFFPSLFALIGTNEATQTLKRLSEDPDVQVRIESVLQIARLGRDDFLPLLRKRLTHSHAAELEAVIFATSALKDSHSMKQWKRHTSSSVDTVRIAAALSLLRAGDRSGVTLIEELAKKGNLFAITALGGVSGAEDLLAELAKSSDLHVRLNAGAALLQRKDARAKPVVAEILIQDLRNIAFQPLGSMGRTLSAIKAVPSAELHADDKSMDLSYSLAIREHLLRESLHLPESDFLDLAKLVMKKQQNDLIPCTIGLLENLQTEGAKALLKEGTSMSAFVRSYCHLALYRLKEEGPHEQYIGRWVLQQKEAELIRFRPLLPWKYRLEQTDYELSAEESSKLLIDSVFAIASRRDERSIGMLLDTISFGHPANRYPLMGLLMKATE